MEYPQDNSFSTFLELFQNLELPLPIRPDSYKDSPNNHTEIPIELAQKYLLTEDDETVDEYTEVMPFGKISHFKAFNCLIYFRGDLNGYKYILLTLDHEGNKIDRLQIAGTHYTANDLSNSVGLIEPDGTIIVQLGISSVGGHIMLHFDTGVKIKYQLLEDGQIDVEL